MDDSPKNSVIQKSNCRVILNRKGVRLGGGGVPIDLLRDEADRQHNNHMDILSILFTAYERLAVIMAVTMGCIAFCDVIPSSGL
jgi:hypothetical protein